MKKMTRKNFLTLFMSVSILTYCFSNLHASDTLPSKDEQQDQAGAVVRYNNNINISNNDALRIIKNTRQIAKNSGLTYCFSNLHASDALPLKAEQPNRTMAIVSSINNTLGKDLLTYILNTRDAAKASGNVCKTWEELRCTSPHLRSTLKSEDQFSQFLVSDYKKINVKFSFIPTAPQLNTLFEKTKVRFLDLSFLPITDEIINNVPALGNLFELNLSFVSEFKDVSTLGKICNLHLNYTQVENVSALVNVRELDVRGTLVKNISVLPNLHKLNVCTTGIDISTLPILANLQTLIFDEAEEPGRLMCRTRELNLSETTIKEYLKSNTQVILN